MQVGTGLVALVADDDADVRALLVHQLRRWGFTTHEAVDGHEAIAAVTRLSPHLVLLDVDMPGADGLTVLAAVRREQAGRPVQSAVLLVTAQASGDDVARGLAAGADDYVRKPFHLGELQQRSAPRSAARGGSPTSSRCARPCASPGCRRVRVSTWPPPRGRWAERARAATSSRWSTRPTDTWWQSSATPWATGPPRRRTRRTPGRC